MKKKPNKKYVQKAWNSYRKGVVPFNASTAQVADTKDAFYAGALILYQGIMVGFDKGKEVTDNDEKMFDDIHEELKQFGLQCEFKSTGKVLQ